MKFPDFIIIGVAKCGTTPLWYNLDKHPEITMAPRSETRGKTEMYFWGTKNYTDKGVEWYKKKFRGKIAGEKTPSYHGRKLPFIQMKKHIPDVKLIICLRHPVDRAYSNWKMNRKGGKVSAEFSHNLFLNRYAKIGRYINSIKSNVLSVFDRDQLHICITEWMKKDTVEEMNKIYDFLNIPRVNIERREVEVTREKNPTVIMAKRRKETWYRVWDQYSDTVSGELRKKMLKYYEESNKKLFDFLGYDIPEWRI
jgi:hypothetical protein